MSRCVSSELGAARALTGWEEATAAQVSKRTLYTHFASKDDLVHAYLSSIEDALLPPETSADEACPDPRRHLLAIFDWDPRTSDGPLRGCPFLNAAVEVPDPDHPVHQLTAAHKTEFTRRLTALARQAGAHDPEELGEQLALLYDGAAARAMAFNSTRAGTHARSIAATLIDAAVSPTPEPAATTP